MVDSRMERRLAAIVAIDVAGYSRLMGADEEGTLAAMKSHRVAAIPIGERHGGRVVGTAGDGELWEFPSVTEAVAAAIEIQALLAKRNQDVPDNKIMLYRIGINLGDVMVDEDDIFGDGVNVAARIEALAKPGEICVSAMVHDSVRDRMSVDFDDMGEVEVKNIARPIKVFRVRQETSDQSVRSPATDAGLTMKRGISRRFSVLAGAALVFLVAIVSGLVWQKPWLPAFAPKLALPDRPSIAVLPFDNMSGDQAQDYFVDGMTEELITGLAKIRGIFVIANNSTATFKGGVIDVRKIAEQLGVRYVLEGSARRAGNTVRINAQLIDAASGGHLWAEKYDGNIADVLKLQDEVTRQIVSALSAHFTGDPEELEIGSGDVINPAAYDLYLQGKQKAKQRSPDSYADAIVDFEKAIALDSQFGRAYADLSSVYFHIRSRFWWKKMGLTYDQVSTNANRFLELALARKSAAGFRLASSRYAVTGKYDEAIEAAKKAVSLGPGDADNVESLATSYYWAGLPSEASEQYAIVHRLDPNTPPIYKHALPYFALGQYEAAEEVLRQALLNYPKDWFGLIFLAATEGHLGQSEKAKSTVELLKQAFPKRRDFTVQSVVGFWPDVRDPNWRKQLAIGLAKAGVPQFPGTFDTSKYIQLSPDQIQNRLFATTYTGRDTDPFTVTRDAEGNFEFSWPGNLRKGFSWVEDGQLCDRFYNPNATNVTCSFVFKSRFGPEDDLLYLVGGRKLTKIIVPVNQ